MEIDQKKALIEDILAASIDSQAMKDAKFFVEVSIESFVADLEGILKEDPGKGEIPASLYERFQEANWKIYVEGEKVLEAVANKGLAKKIKDYFRKRAGYLAYQSVITDNGYKKLFGYPGDFQMMNYVYERKIRSSARMGQYFDRFFVENNYAEAVRGRKDKMVSILQREVENTDADKIRIFNLPCGPARDVKDFLSLPLDTAAEVFITCVDQDQAALDFAMDYVGVGRPGVTISYQKGDILGYVRNSVEHIARLGKFDLVYSIGIADYLPDKIMSRMIGFAYELLAPGGLLVFAYKIKSKDPLAPLPPKWFCDWEFVPRNVDDVMKNFSDAGLVNSEMLPLEWEKSGRIAFFEVKRLR